MRARSWVRDAGGCWSRRYRGGVTPNVRFHATPAQVVWGGVPTVLTCALIVWFMFRLGAPSTLVAAAALWTFVAAVVVVFVQRWRGLELTESHAVVRENRTREIPWRDVTGVRAGSRMGRRFIVVELARGRVQCSAPTTGLLGADPDFDEKLAYVQRWWLRCAPRDAAPAPHGTALGWGIPVLSDEIGRSRPLS